MKKTGSARDLTLRARSEVGSMDAAKLEELATRYLDEGNAPDVGDFVHWARTHAA